MLFTFSLYFCFSLFGLITFLYTMKIKEPLKLYANNLKHLAKRIYIRITVYIVEIIDGIHDILLCGSLLARHQEVNVKGATDYSPTRYWALDEIFKDAVFTNDDSMVDIGCGKGRVLVWYINKHFPGQITGIEKDPNVAAIAKKWMTRHQNKKTRLVEGDALEQSYNDYTFIYLFRPFNYEFFKQLILRLESQITHPIQLYYLTDYYSKEFLTDRQGWKMKERRLIYKKYGLYLSLVPQHYSIWTYNPHLNLGNYNSTGT